jgi:hypothetical protein
VEVIEAGNVSFNGSSVIELEFGRSAEFAAKVLLLDSLR